MKKIIALLLVLVIVLSLVACSNATDALDADVVIGDRNGDGVVKVGFANIAETVYQHYKIKESFEVACANRGWELVYMCNNLDGQTAVANADQMLLMGIDYMVEYNVDQSVAPAIMKAMNEADVPVIAIDIAHEGAVYLGANNYGIGLVVGKYAGEYVKEVWGEAEAILIVEDAISGEAVLARTDNIVDGYREVFPDFPDDKVWKVDGGVDTSDSQRVVADWLAAHPDFSKILICPAHVTMRLGASAAIEIAEREADCLIVSQGEYDYLDYIDNNPEPADWEVFVASAVYNFQSYGEEACKLIDMIIAGDLMETEYYPEHYMIDRDNYMKFFASYFEE